MTQIRHWTLFFIKTSPGQSLQLHGFKYYMFANDLQTSILGLNFSLSFKMHTYIQLSSHQNLLDFVKYINISVAKTELPTTIPLTPASFSWVPDPSGMCLSPQTPCLNQLLFAQRITSPPSPFSPAMLVPTQSLYSSFLFSEQILGFPESLSFQYFLNTQRPWLFVTLQGRV